MKDTRAPYIIEAVEIGRTICILEGQLETLKYNFNNSANSIQKELSQLWLRKGQLERIYGISAIAK
jgi:hypothetical protein